MYTCTLFSATICYVSVFMAKAASYKLKSFSPIQAHIGAIHKYQ